MMALPSETTKASGQNTSHQNHNTGALQKLEPQTESASKHCRQWQLLWAPCSSYEVQGSHGSLGVDNRFILLWGEQLLRFDGDTWLGVGVSMNDELSLFMTTTFPTVEPCFHSGGLYLNCSQNRALYSPNARSHDEPSVGWWDPENSASQRPHLSLTETVTQHTCLPSSV